MFARCNYVKINLSHIPTRVMSLFKATRLFPSNFWALIEIRRTKFLKYIKFVNRQTLKLLFSVSVGRVFKVDKTIDSFFLN